MIKVTCDQTGEDLTGKIHLTVTRQSFRQQDGLGAWRPITPRTDRGGILCFKDWDALAAWGKEQEQYVTDEWYTAPAREPRVVT